MKVNKFTALISDWINTEREREREREGGGGVVPYGKGLN